MHDYSPETDDDIAIFYTFDAESVLIQNSHFSQYYEVNFVSTPVHILNSLFEDMSGDGVDFDNSPADTVIESSTIKNGIGDNIDGIDFGKVFYLDRPTAQGTVKNCLIYNISDKGVSVGELSEDVSVYNTLIYDVGTGVSAKDRSNLSLENVTISSSDYGINLYEERSGYLGGLVTAQKIILYNNIENIHLEDYSELELESSYIDNLSNYSGNSYITFGTDLREGAESFSEEYLPDEGSSIYASGWGYQPPIGVSQ